LGAAGEAAREGAAADDMILANQAEAGDDK
jgi:hypothetical protein